MTKDKRSLHHFSFDYKNEVFLHKTLTEDEFSHYVTTAIWHDNRGSSGPFLIYRVDEHIVVSYICFVPEHVEPLDDFICAKLGIVIDPEGDEAGEHFEPFDLEEARNHYDEERWWF